MNPDEAAEDAFWAEFYEGLAEAARTNPAFAPVVELGPAGKAALG